MTTHAIGGSPDAAALGWPFLVAAGRRRDYAVVLAPDFLVASGDQGFLVESVPPVSEHDGSRTVIESSDSGRRLHVTYHSHVLTPVDLRSPDGEVGPPSSARDEHNRPLRLMVGFVSEQGPSGPEEDVAADLDECLPVALAAYRDFLDDEEDHDALPSHGLPLRSLRWALPVLKPAAGSAGTAPTLEASTTVVLESGAVAPHDSAPVKGSRRVAAAVAVLALGAVLLGFRVVGGSTAPTPPPPSCTPTTTTTRAPAAEGIQKSAAPPTANDCGSSTGIGQQP